jgi:hypothetical protein
MMDYGLLVSMDVLEFIERLPRRTRLGLRAGMIQPDATLNAHF